MSFLLLLALALAPGIYLAFLILGKDKYDREPKRVLLVAFLLGCLSAVVSGLVESLIIKGGIDEPRSMFQVFLMTFFSIALVEEGCKFLALRFHAFPHREFSEPLDGIVYGVFVSLGFATLENVGYVIQHGYIAGVIRMFTAVPAHFIFGVIMGYYVGKARYNQGNRLGLLLQGLLFATVLHGAYDFFLIQQWSVWLYLFMFVVLIYGWLLSRKAIKELQEDSLFRFRRKQEELEDDFY